MKNRLAALVAVSVLIATVPVSATEATLSLRGVETSAPAMTRVGTTTAKPSTDAASARKVRVVLGSPYGN